MYIGEFYNLVVGKVIEYIGEVTIICYKKVFKGWQHFLVKVGGTIKAELLSEVKFLETVTCKCTSQVQSI